MTPTSMTPELQSFLQMMLTEAYGDTLPTETRDIMVEDLYPRLEQTLSLAMLAKLTPEQLEEVENMSTEGVPAEQIQVYVTKNIPDYTVVLQDALKEFWTLYIAPTNESKEEEV